MIKQNRIEGLQKYWPALFFLGLGFYEAFFCAVYRNTQKYLLCDTIISFGLGLLYPFGLYLIPGFLRINSIKNKNKKCLYKISKYAQSL